ncbi:MAG: metallophosphoesterase [Oscillospiraceae bacterium]|nr:metallophosphoesterase [Oscillospiraceae bacterium]MBQ5412848.1 metallophosphoesterase [Oscillospiraceae bacterium]
MALFVISDPHLSFGVDKPMNIFEGWGNYEKRLAENWTGSVGPSDSVVIPGDISWGLDINETLPDLRFIDELPGTKYILKGNHDLWWPTMKKLTAFLEENGISSIIPVFRNAYEAEGVAVCGTRSWFYDSSEPKEKVFSREMMRLEASLQEAQKLGTREIIAFLHYPPVFHGMVVQEAVDLLKKYGVRRCYYGHVHGKNINYAFNGVYEDIRFRLVSADALSFRPLMIDTDEK